MTLETNLTEWAYSPRTGNFKLNYVHQGNTKVVITNRTCLLNMLDQSLLIEAYDKDLVFTPILLTPEKSSYSKMWMSLDNYMENVFTDDDAYVLIRYNEWQMRTPKETKILAGQ